MRPPSSSSLLAQTGCRVAFRPHTEGASNGLAPVMVMVMVVAGSSHRLFFFPPIAIKNEGQHAMAFLLLLLQITPTTAHRKQLYTRHLSHRRLRRMIMIMMMMMWVTPRIVRIIMVAPVLVAVCVGVRQLLQPCKKQFVVLQLGKGPHIGLKHVHTDVVLMMW